MRWLFLFLLVLNLFYYVWHQQQAPLRPKEVETLSLYKGDQQDIRLLSESGEVPARRVLVPRRLCASILEDLSRSVMRKRWRSVSLASM
jgi:hypothetical protein